MITVTVIHCNITFLFLSGILIFLVRKISSCVDRQQVTACFSVSTVDLGLVLFFSFTQYFHLPKCKKLQGETNFSEFCKMIPTIAHSVSLQCALFLSFN